MRYLDYLREQGKDLIAMIHLPAMPGTPRHDCSPDEIVGAAVAEAETLRDAGVGTVMIENMHDVPYTKAVGPEVPTVMAIAGREIKRLGLRCGVQVLAGCNREALAVAHAAGLDFVRAEGFVFGHVGDEGYFDACAGELLRYRKAIGADDVAVFTDIKKKHSSHAITADLDLAEVADAARFFLSDGVVVTGTSTGRPADVAQLESLAACGLPRLVGSGITPDNLADYLPLAEGFIVGSWFKKDGNWMNPPDPDRVARLVEAFQALVG